MVIQYLPVVEFFWVFFSSDFVFVSTLLGIFYDSLSQNYKLNNFDEIFLRASEGIRTPE